MDYEISDSPPRNEVEKIAYRTCLTCGKKEYK